MRAYLVTSSTPHYSGRGDGVPGTVEDIHLVCDAPGGVRVLNDTVGGTFVGVFTDDAHYVWWATTMLGRSVERIDGPTPTAVAPSWAR